MGNHKKYWKSELELSSDNPIVNDLKNNEFVNELPADAFQNSENSLEDSSTNRRDFLKYLGFTTAAATLASCEGPVNRSIPYVVQPEQIIPGISNFYATSISDGFDFANVLVKTREGRPIKIELNKQSDDNTPNARVQASVLSMYDSSRLQGPTMDGQDISWDQFNLNVKAQLDAMKASSKRVVLLTQTFASPTTESIIENFTKKYPNVEHIIYDAISDSKALDAFELSFGVRALPTYDFEKAQVIVSLAADFLGDWQGGGFSKGYAKNRVPKNGKMSKHYQIEANMSLSGANADVRIPLKPSNQIKALLKIYENLSGYFTKASDVVGRALKKTLSVDKALLSRHLEIDWDIRKGQKIIIQSIAGPVTIENSGVARVNAQIGELIKAKNEQSGKIVEGIVVSRKKIRVLTK